MFLRAQETFVQEMLFTIHNKKKSRRKIFFKFSSILYLIKNLCIYCLFKKFLTELILIIIGSIYT